ncbi:MAG: hypothetical protein PHW74_03320 [Desulfobacca sp.]|nr:hypothetical protein [Desulfobacca sp.]
MPRLWRNRDFLMLLALTLGLGAGQGAAWTEVLVLPALAVVMTLSTMGVPGQVFRSPRALIYPILVGLALNFVVLGGLLLGLNLLLIGDDALSQGFVLLVAVPPAVAVIPFTSLLHGNSTFSLIATIGAYLGALIITPLIAVALLGTAFIHPVKLILVLIELILIPLIVSRLLLWSGLSGRLEPIKGAITNWSFFLITYTIVGLNQELFLRQPLTLLPVALIALASTFILGTVIDRLARLAGVEPPTITSLMLLGTLKNYALAGGLALTLFSQQTAVPAAVSTIFMIVYIIWLGFQKRHSAK